MLAPPRDRIDVWWRRHDSDTPPDELNRACAILTPPEREANRRFAPEERRREDLLTRAMVRSLAAGYLGLPTADVVFGKGPRARPSIASPHAGGLTFNIAHADGLIVCAFGCDRRLGVDVETARPEEDRSFLVEHLSKTERADVGRMAAEAAGGRLLQYWVLKEAYLKALGLGLSVSPAACTFAIGPGGAPRLLHGVDEDRHRAADWTFAFIDLSAQHLTALGYSSPPGERVTVRVHRFVGAAAQA